MSQILVIDSALAEDQSKISLSYDFTHIRPFRAKSVSLQKAIISKTCFIGMGYRMYINRNTVDEFIQIGLLEQFHSLSELVNRLDFYWKIVDPGYTVSLVFETVSPDSRQIIQIEHTTNNILIKPSLTHPIIRQLTGFMLDSDTPSFIQLADKPPDITYPHYLRVNLRFSGKSISDPIFYPRVDQTDVISSYVSGETIETDSMTSSFIIPLKGLINETVTYNLDEFDTQRIQIRDKISINTKITVDIYDEFGIKLPKFALTRYILIFKFN